MCDEEEEEEGAMEEGILGGMYYITGPSELAVGRKSRPRCNEVGWCGIGSNARRLTLRKGDGGP